MNKLTIIIKDKPYNLDNLLNQSISVDIMSIYKVGNKKVRTFDNMNEALRNIKTKYFAIIKGSTILDKDYALNMTNLIDRQNGDSIICDYYNKDKLKRHIKTFLPCNIENIKMLINVNASLDNKVFRTSFIKNTTYFDDLSFTYIMLKRSKKIVKLDKALVYINNIKYSNDLYKSIDLIKKEYGAKYYDKALNIATKYIIENIVNKNINIDDGYKYLEDNFKEYKSSYYFKSLNIKNRIIRKHKMLMKIFN